VIEQFTFQRIDLNSELKPFDCGDNDLNDFFCNDAINYLRHLLAVTYVFENNSGTETVAFFSVLNDRISREEIDKRTCNRIERKIPRKKHFKGYPAVKIGRFGVHSNYHRRKIGTEVIDFIKVFFTQQNKTGCRFITVDAYNTPVAISFYTANGFKYLTTQDEREDTRSMYFDLITFVRS